MNHHDQSRPIARTSPLPLVRMTLACRDGDSQLEGLLDRYRAEGVFVPTDRVRPVGERIRLRIELLDSVKYTSEASVAAHEWNGSTFGMRLFVKPPQRNLQDGRTSVGLAATQDLPLDSPALSTPAVSLAEYLCEPEVALADATTLEEDPATDVADDADIPIVEPPETRFSGHWPSSVCEISMHPSVEAVEALYRTWMKAREWEPMTALAAAEAMIDLSRSDPSGHLVRSVRSLTRDGHEILELALQHLERARTPEHRCEAQQLFDEALHTVVVP